MGHTFEPAVHSMAARELATLESVAVGSEETRPEVVNHLEALDDVIFAAIDGDQAALQESAAAWHRAVKTLGNDAIEETRRQYLRHAQSVWESLRHQSVQPPQKIFAAIEIIGLLVNSER
jgi:hydroxyethylthiazole kinase-like sugar kinase family protein